MFKFFELDILPEQVCNLLRDVYQDFYVNAYVYWYTVGQYRNYSILLSNIEIFIDYISLASTPMPLS
jgi:hypothetical protein